MFRSIWPAPTFEQFFIFGISSCIWSPQIGQTLSAHEGWNQRKNAKGQLVESMPITISHRSILSPWNGWFYTPIGFIPLLNPYLNWFGGCGSQHGNDMQWCCQNSTPQSSWNEMKYRMLPRFGRSEAGVQKKWMTMEDVPYRRVLVGGSAHLILTYI